MRSMSRRCFARASPRPEELAACKAQASKRRALQAFLHRGAAPERFDHIQDDPHAVRRLRHRAWAILGQEMRPLQHALLWARMPGAALERRVVMTSSAKE